jgi:hypothetical protein
MGSSNSKLICPSGYDKNKFSVIMKLYRYLDLNGNRSLTKYEIVKFTKVFYECELLDLEELTNMLRKKIIVSKETVDESISSAVYKFEQRCHKINRNNKLTKDQYEEKFKIERQKREMLNNMLNEMENKIVESELEIELIKSLNEKQRAEKLIDDINKKSSGKNYKEVSFKSFFTFIKDKNVFKLGTVLE